MLGFFFFGEKRRRGFQTFGPKQKTEEDRLERPEKFTPQRGRKEGGREATCLHCLHAPQDVYTQSFFREKRAGETSHRFFKKRPLCPLAWFTRTHFTLRLLCPGEKRVRRVAESSSLVCVCVCFVYRQLPIKQPAATAAAAAAAAATAAATASPRDSGGEERTEPPLYCARGKKFRSEIANARKIKSHSRVRSEKKTIRDGVTKTEKA